eukprot:m51a1_g6909 putative serine threonine kinase (1378) ;mRNA; r:108481-116551
MEARSLLAGLGLARIAVLALMTALEVVVFFTFWDLSLYFDDQSSSDAKNVALGQLLVITCCVLCGSLYTLTGFIIATAVRVTNWRPTMKRVCLGEQYAVLSLTTITFVLNVALAVLVLGEGDPHSPMAASRSQRPQCAGVKDIVIGQSVGTSQTELGAARGLRAAIDEANSLTKLTFVLKQYNHSSDDDIVRNARRLVEEDCVFLIAASTGTSYLEARVVDYFRNYSVPLVGTLSASMALRNVSLLLADYDIRGVMGPSFTVHLPFVANIRASGIDEIDTVMSMLSHDWDLLSCVGLVTHDTQFDKWTTDYVNKSLRALTGHPWGLRSFVQLPMTTGHIDSAQVDSKLLQLFANGQVKALVVATLPNATADFVTELALWGHTDLLVFFAAWVTPEDLEEKLTAPTKALLHSNRIKLLFTQNMPSPTPDKPWMATPLQRRFGASVVPPAQRSHMALEGYLTGWFIYEVAQQAIARTGLPLTPLAFLRTLFVDVRTFNVLGMTLGPYGDGGFSGGPDMQSSGDACNQGVHEVFMTSWDPQTGVQTPLQGATLKFAGCRAPDWSANGQMTVVGSFDDISNGMNPGELSGLLGAVNLYNSQGASTMVLRSKLGNISDAANDLAASKVTAMVASELRDPTYVKVFKSVATFAPIPGYFILTRPFNRRVINLFPSAYDEMAAAVQWFQSKNVKRLAFILSKESEYDAFLILGGSFYMDSVSMSRRPRLLNSRVRLQHGELRPNMTWVNMTGMDMTSIISVTPPLPIFASTSALRIEFSTWVSSSNAAGDPSVFAGFIAGRFLSQVVDVARGSDPSKNITADDLLDAVYSRSVFVVDGLQFGPFTDKCSDTTRDCCNQGSNTVYILQGGPALSVTPFVVGNCGRWYLPAESKKPDKDDTSLVLGLSIGLGGGGLICITAVILLAIWRASRTLEYLNIQRGEIEIGQCLGQGHLGAMYMADWHGTTVAVRMIDKKATSKEDQKVVKEEVLLLHKLHHPNLLMLMGYCETRSDILVVTEYMEGGTLAAYLRKEKRYASVYSLVAMAFMDSKGTVKVSDLWFSSKRGALSSSGSGRSLKRAAWLPPEVIASTFLTQATDVYAFGVVLWELIAPPEMVLSSSASATASESQHSSVPASPAAAAAVPPSPSPGLMNLGDIASVVEMHNAQMGPPEVPPNASPEVADLMRSDRFDKKKFVTKAMTKGIRDSGSNDKFKKLQEQIKQSHWGEFKIVNRKVQTFLTFKDREHCHKDKLCFVCQSPNHNKEDCPNIQESDMIEFLHKKGYKVNYTSITVDHITSPTVMHDQAKDDTDNPFRDVLMFDNNVNAQLDSGADRMMINIKYVKKLQWGDHHFICKFENLLIFEYNHAWNKLVKEQERANCLQSTSAL